MFQEAKECILVGLHWEVRPSAVRGSNGTGSQLLRVTATTYSRAGQIVQMTLKASFRLPADNWDDFNCLSQFISGQLNKHPSRMWKVQQDNFLLFWTDRQENIHRHCLALCGLMRYCMNSGTSWSWSHCTAACLIIYRMAAWGWHITNHISVITARADD